MNGHSELSVDYTPLKPVERGGDKVEACLWFDIDNCLYSNKAGIAPMMGNNIHKYFVKMGLDENEAWELHMTYYKQYGLAVRGLMKHYPAFDAQDFDRECDGALPLDELLGDDKPLQQLLRDVDRTKVKVMALTNANKPHALRVLRILGVTDLFEGVVSCQYSNMHFPAKPDAAFFEQAMQICGIADPAKHFFVDDSALNCRGAQKLGWNAWLFDEDNVHEYAKGEITGKVTSLQDLRNVWRQWFTQNSA